MTVTCRIFDIEGTEPVITVTCRIFDIKGTEPIMTVTCRIFDARNMSHFVTYAYSLETHFHELMLASEHRQVCSWYTRFLLM